MVKMIWFIIVLCLFSNGVLAADPTVNTDTGKKKTTQKIQQVTREKSIDLEKSKSDRSLDEIEKLKSRSFNTDYLQQYTNRAETQAVMLFEPLVTAIERGNVKTGDNKVADIIRRCGLYSYPHPTATSLFILPVNGAILHIGNSQTNVGVDPIHNYGGSAVTVQTPPGYPLYVTIKGEGLYKYHEAMEKKPQRFAPPSEALRCYIAYGYVLSETIKEMAGEAVGVKKLDPAKGKVADTYFLLESLEAVAGKALVAVMTDPTTLTKINFYTEQLLEGGCVLPTLAALNVGKFSWSCGGIDVDPSTGLAKRNGTPYFGENTFMGTSAVFAQVDALAMTTSSSLSDLERKSAAKEVNTLASTRLSKRKGQDSAVSTDNTIDSAAGIGK